MPPEGRRHDADHQRDVNGLSRLSDLALRQRIALDAVFVRTQVEGADGGAGERESAVDARRACVSDIDRPDAVVWFRETCHPFSGARVPLWTTRPVTTARASSMMLTGTSWSGEEDLAGVAPWPAFDALEGVDGEFSERNQILRDSYPRCRSR